MSESIIPNMLKSRLIEAINKEARFDGRKLSEYRDIKIERGISKNAESSVKVSFGKTEVLAGVKMAITEPYPDSQDEGTFMTTVELHPLASNDFEMGKPGIQSVEFARVIDRGIRESGFIDFKKLCIKEGEKVWQIFLDIFAINDDGNLLDVMGLAAIVALGSAKLPVYNKKEEKIEHELSKDSLPLVNENLSFNMTFHKIGEKIVADISKDEEAVSNYRISLAMGEVKGKPRITAIQKGKEGAISQKDMENILNTAELKLKEMFPRIEEEVFGKGK